MGILAFLLVGLIAGWLAGMAMGGRGFGILGNVIVGVFQESRAKRQLDQIALLVRPKATVIREGREQDVAPDEIVKDDLLLLRPGDQIQTDGEVIGEEGFSVDEAMLTGESDFVPKRAGDMVFSATYAMTGSAVYKTTKVGVDRTVTIGSKESAAVEEAKRRIELILDPPTAELGVPYTGKVVNITKFGAFVNILPGRDGLLHISKLGQGKRIDKVEDVVDLGDEVEVRVDDIDQQGKVSLSIAGDAPAAKEGASEGGSSEGGAVASASFEDFLDGEIGDSLGDLGPAEEKPAREDRGDRGPRRNPRRR